MADPFRIIPYTVRSAGTDVPPEEVQAAINSLAQQTTIALNSVASDPSGPASGDLGGTYPAPTVVAVHATGGTLDGVVIGGTTPAAATVTTLTASTPIGVTSGGTGANALNAHNVLIGEGSSAVGFAAPGTAGQMLISTGATTDPAFGGAPTITGGSINAAPIGQTTPAAGNFTTLAASTAVTVPSGGTGRATLTAHAVIVGEGTSAVNQIGPGTTGQMLLGATGADPAFGNNPTITGGTIDGAVIGGTTPAAGSFTTLSSTGNFTPSQTNGIVGTTTNNSANAGSVGEFLPNTTSGTSLTSTVAANATSISLTAGDWDVTGVVQFVPGAGATVTVIGTGTNTTSATFGAFQMNSIITGISAPAASGSLSLAAPVTRFSLSATTTVFLIASSTFSGGTQTCNGFIRARRVR